MTKHNLKVIEWVLLVTIFVASSMMVAQQPNAGIYTAQQAAAGRTSYEANCAGCHQQNMAGSGDAAALRGSQFVANWGPRTTRELLSFIQLTMPPARPGMMNVDEYAGIVAYILQANGSPAGNQPLTAGTDVRINSVATGSVATGQAPSPAARGAAAPRPAQARGLTVSGEVKNYVPVTDAMLRDPSPNDWLMIRHDYQSSNYSPLNQITRDNVKDLRLQWAWAMSEGGGGNGNGPAPIVHNGVLYINNDGNTMQALDARSGELIWENNYGTNMTAPAMRGITIYEDKIILATSNARLIALDARTGKTIWQTVIGDRSKGEYTTTSGPLIVKGKVIQGLGT